LLQYTKNKETLKESFVKLSSLDVFLQVTREWADETYRATIYMNDYPKQVVFRAYDPVDAVLQTLKLMEIFDGIAYELRKKHFLFWRFVKETFPECGIANVNNYDPDRLSWTNETKSFQKFVSDLNKQRDLEIMEVEQRVK